MELYEQLKLLKPVIQDRVFTLSEIKGWLIPFLTEPNCDLKDLEYKTLDLSLVRNIIKLTIDTLSSWELDWQASNLEKEFRNLASLNNIKAGEFFFPVRVAITGSKVSLPLFETMEALGQTTVLKRLRKVLDRLEDVNG